MQRPRKKTIAIRGSEIRRYESEAACGQDLGVTTTAVQMAKRWNATTAGEWFIYDTPDVIRKRIAELEKQIVMLNSLGIE